MKLPIVFEFNSWVCSFRFAWGEDAPAEEEKQPAMGFHIPVKGEHHGDEEGKKKTQR